MSSAVNRISRTRRSRYYVHGVEKNLETMSIRISCITSLYRCGDYLQDFLSCLVGMENLPELEFILIHNDPLIEEENVLEVFIDDHPELVINYQKITREGLYRSWNRAIRLAKGELITIWNVDDIRFPDSFSHQANALSTNGEAVLVYGNRYLSGEYGSKQLDPWIVDEIISPAWFKKFQGGCFFMWRKEIHSQIGYFDEQLISAGDQDFWYRVVEKYRVLKTDHYLGIYLNKVGSGLSKNRDEADIEKLVIGARYGYYTYLNNWNWLQAIHQYRWRRIFYFGRSHRCSIFRYRSPLVYGYSAYTLIKSLIKHLIKKVFHA